MRALRALGTFLITAVMYLGVALLGWYLGGPAGRLCSSAPGLESR